MSIAIFAAVLGISSALQQPEICPAETASSRRIVDYFTSAPTFGEIRSRYNLPPASAPARLLTDEFDSEACRGLNRYVRTTTNSAAGRVIPSFYQDGNYYYVILSRGERKQTPPPGHVHVSLGWTPLLILDRSFNKVAALAM